MSTARILESAQRPRIPIPVAVLGVLLAGNGLYRALLVLEDGTFEPISWLQIPLGIGLLRLSETSRLLTLAYVWVLGGLLTAVTALAGLFGDVGFAVQGEPIEHRPLRALLALGVAALLAAGLAAITWALCRPASRSAFRPRSPGAASAPG